MEVEWGKKRKIAGILTAGVILIVVVYLVYAFFIPYREQTLHGQAYEPTSVLRGSYRLESIEKTVLGKDYVSFVILEESTGERIYQCPGLWPLEEMKTIGWDSDEDSYHVVVRLDTETFYRYVFDGETWNQEK